MALAETFVLPTTVVGVQERYTAVILSALGTIHGSSYDFRLSS
jgi:hypothetical protein